MHYKTYDKWIHQLMQTMRKTRHLLKMGVGCTGPVNTNSLNCCEGATYHVSAIQANLFHLDLIRVNNGCIRLLIPPYLSTKVSLINRKGTKGTVIFHGCRTIESFGYAIDFCLGLSNFQGNGFRTLRDRYGMGCLIPLNLCS
jgi:hypothetical protein